MNILQLEDLDYTKMSRYQIPMTDLSSSLYIGWDPTLKSYFAYIERIDSFDEKEIVFRTECRYKEIYDPLVLLRVLDTYIPKISGNFTLINKLLNDKYCNSCKDEEYFYI